MSDAERKVCVCSRLFINEALKLKRLGYPALILLIVAFGIIPSGAYAQTPQGAYFYCELMYSYKNGSAVNEDTRFQDAFTGRRCTALITFGPRPGISAATYVRAVSCTVTKQQLTNGVGCMVDLNAGPTSRINPNPTKLWPTQARVDSPIVTDLERAFGCISTSTDTLITPSDSNVGGATMVDQRYVYRCSGKNDVHVLE